PAGTRSSGASGKALSGAWAKGQRVGTFADRHPISGLCRTDLSDEEEAVLAVELVQLISRAKYPFSDRVRTLGAILNKLRPEPRELPPSPLKRYEPPPRGRYRTRG